MELMSGGVNPAPAPTSYRHLLGVPSTDDFIVAIDKVTLMQSAASADSGRQDHRWGHSGPSPFWGTMFALQQTSRKEYSRVVHSEYNNVLLCSGCRDYSLAHNRLAWRPLVAVVCTQSCPNND